MQRINCAGTLGPSLGLPFFGRLRGYRTELQEYYRPVTVETFGVSGRHGVFRKPVPFAKRTARNPRAHVSLDERQTRITS